MAENKSNRRSPTIFQRAADIEQLDVGKPTLNGYADGHLAGVQRRVSDLRYGGQMGYSPDFTTWVNFHPYVSRNLIPILIEPPLGFRRLPNSELWINALRSMVETMPMSIEGLNSQLDVSTAQTAFGGAGQEFDSYTNVKQVKPDITFTWKERTGIPIYRFHSAWIRYLMMDPNTKNATINTIEGHTLSDLMADQYSMTMLFIEPDELHRYVNQAWLVTNMFPTTTGPNTAKRDMANDMETRDVAVKYTGIAQDGAGVEEFAQNIMDHISIIGADPHARESFVKDISGYIDREHSDGSKGSGYESSAEMMNPLNRIKANSSVGSSSGRSATGAGATGP